MRKKLILPVFIIIVFGYHLVVFTFLTVRSRFRKIKSFFKSICRQDSVVYPRTLWIPAIVFSNLERKTVPVEEPNYHLSIEPGRCPDKTKEKFILFYTPIAANATRVRDGANPTSS